MTSDSLPIPPRLAGACTLGAMDRQAPLDDAADADYASRDRGQALVETALLLPILIFILIGASDLTRAYSHQYAVQNGARAGAEATAIDFATPTAAKAISRARDEMNSTPGMSSSTPAVTVSFLQANDDTRCVDPPNIATPCYVTVRVQYTFRTIVSWPLIPNTVVMDRTTKIRLLTAPHCGTNKTKSNKNCTGHTHGSSSGGSGTGGSASGKSGSKD